jgi:hypothetical protein
MGINRLHFPFDIKLTRLRKQQDAGALFLPCAHELCSEHARVFEKITGALLLRCNEKTTNFSF